MAGDADKWEPETRETADHSMPYTVAVALIHGTVTAEHFAERYLHDPAIRALTQVGLGVAAGATLIALGALALSRTEQFAGAPSGIVRLSVISKMS